MDNDKSCFAKNPMTEKQLEQKIQFFANYKIELVLKDNRSTFLRVIDTKKNMIKLLLHKLFLFSSENICRAIARYIKLSDKKSLKEVKLFAQGYFSRVDYSHTIDAKKLRYDGNVYNLKDIEHRLNKRYFHEAI